MQGIQAPKPVGERKSDSLLDEPAVDFDHPEG